MSLLNRFFEETESLAIEIEKDNKSIIQHWNSYKATINQKEAIILKLDLKLKDLNKLKSLLELELIDISNEEKEESELISDLETLEHSKKIKRIQRLVSNKSVC